ncbi:hypothetical protein EDB84DRAFT_1122130 [Lactarius hengduanensis]|nr:hypothetical protein EDB84DRAFT_1122130 [Lactarius hengduanensis]
MLPYGARTPGLLAASSRAVLPSMSTCQPRSLYMPQRFSLEFFPHFSGYRHAVGNPIESTPPHHRRDAQSQRYSKAKASNATFHLSALAVASRLERKGVRRWGRCRLSWPGRRVYGDNFPVPDIFVELHCEQRHDDTVESMRASRTKPFGPGGSRAGYADRTLAQESSCNHKLGTKSLLREDRSCINCTAE